MGLVCADITAGPSPFYFSTSVMWLDLMDPSAGSRPPTPTGPRTRAGSKQKSLRSGTASPSTGAAPHQAAVPWATSTTCPAMGSSGSFEPLRDDDNNDDDADLASSPVLLSNPGDVGDTPATGNATASSSSDSAVRSGTVSSMATKGLGIVVQQLYSHLWPSGQPYPAEVSSCVSPPGFDQYRQGCYLLRSAPRDQYDSYVGIASI